MKIKRMDMQDHHMHNCLEVEIECNLCRKISMKRGVLKEH
jgi:hypothetical protein